MIAKKNRFHGHNSVSRVRGQSVHAPLFSVYYARNRRRDYRMAVVVSKKTAKSAVVRNRIRRRLYEAVRTARLFNDQSLDVVFVVRSDELAGVPSAQLLLQLSSVAEKITASLDGR